MNAPTVNGNNLLVQGRIVWTSGRTLFEGKKKLDYNTNAPIFDENNQPIIEYGFGLAIPKIDPRTGQPTAEFQKVWQLLHQEAFTLYPSGQLPPDFAMKYKDGDGVDHQGQPFGNREGYKNHIVLACTTQIPIKYFVFEGGNNVLVNSGIKCGDYVNVQLNVKAHPAKGRGKAGLYINPSAVQLIQAGKEIINTPSGDQMFGMQAPAYNGQVDAYVAPQMPMGAPAMPPQGVNFSNPAYPAYNQAPPVQPDPYYNVLPPTHQPQMPMGNGAPPVIPQATGMGNMQGNYPTMNTGMSVPQAAYPSNNVPNMPPIPMR